MSSKHTPGPWVVDDGGEGNHEIWAPESGSMDAICYVGTEEDLADEEKYARYAANARLIAKAPEMYDELRRQEWSGVQHGQGFGPMHNPGLGRAYPACPRCGGIKPDSGAEVDFNKSAIGHRGRCPLAKLLNEIDGGEP